MRTAPLLLLFLEPMEPPRPTARYWPSGLYAQQRAAVLSCDVIIVLLLFYYVVAMVDISILVY